MTWAIGVLTWNDPAMCSQTLDALTVNVGAVPIVVLDNGSDTPFTHNTVMVVRQAQNLGAGGGMSALVKALLDLQVDAMVCLEDDWLLERTMTVGTLEPFVADPDVGQVRLACRPISPHVTYYTYGLKGQDAVDAQGYVHSPLISYADGYVQRIRSLWSNNPFACSRTTAERFLLTGQDEKRMARPYYASGLTTVTTTPGYFRHQGAIRDRRKKAGWTK